MATVLELVFAKKLFKLDPALEPNEQEWRSVHTSPRFRGRVENDLPQWKSQWRQELSPTQQFDALFEQFCSGEVLTYGHRFKPLNHLGDGIWELKTPDLRIFGWFWNVDCFIATGIDTAYQVKNHNLYAGYAGEAGRFREQTDLNEPKFVPGEDPHAVVSSFDYP